MTNEQFEGYRNEFAYFIADLRLSEIRAMRQTFEKLNGMSDGQREALIQDLSLMEHYKIKVMKEKDDFNRIMKGIQS